VFSLSKKNNAFARRGQDLLSAVTVPVDRPDTVLHVQLIADQLANPGIFEGIRRPAENIKRRSLPRPARLVRRQQRRDDELILALTVRVYGPQVVQRRLFVDLDRSPRFVEVLWPPKQPHAAAIFRVQRLIVI